MKIENQKWAGGKSLRLLIVVAGVALGQAILYGPSLIGQRILLPLDLLALPGMYIPQTVETAKIVPHNFMLVDLIDVYEPARQFAASEIHQGRFPLWAPYQYGGVPFVWPKYSLFLFLESCVKSPVVLAWVQLLAALVAGGGMYLFCRQTLRVSFWPAAVCAWCYPLTAFFVLWQGSAVPLPVCWLPWIFLCVDKIARRGGGALAIVGLSVVTFLILTSGGIDVACQVLLGSGFFALWCLWIAHGRKRRCQKPKLAVAMLIVGWSLGFFLAAPHLLPLLQYAKTGARLQSRSKGAEVRPPIGVTAAPQVILPEIYGDTATGSAFIPLQYETNLLESPSAAYAGVLATLLVAPLAWCRRRHRAINAFWLFLALFGVSWCLDIPGFVQLLRLPGMNMMSHNRLTFLTSFAILSLTAIGLDCLLRRSLKRRWWFWLPAVLLAGCFTWCIYRSYVLPEPLATQLENELLHGQASRTIFSLHDLRQIQAWFTLHYAVMALLCGLGFAGWLFLWFQKSAQFRLFPILAIILVGDLLWFDYGRNPQCDPALYYPKIPVLDEIAKSIPGRVMGFHCLQAALASMAGLNDIRGADGFDPGRMVALVQRASEPINKASSATQVLSPKGRILPPDNIQLSPILNMLNVRYVIFRGTPQESMHFPFQGDDYWALVNSNVLPRVFVPESVQTVSNADDELQQIASQQFDAAKTTFVESPVQLPADCRGTAHITNEIPTHITISVKMETPG
ncbi:MAG TPA: hypothetical protein VH280_10175, partial [Verrucomicrobiae bacterium]|nr:hypothetical protein [Verrucomicrobiae bacterium]